MPRKQLPPATCPVCKQEVPTEYAYGSGPAVIIASHDRPNYKRNDPSEVGPICPGSHAIAEPSPIVIPDRYRREVCGGTWHYCAVCGEVISAGEIMIRKLGRFTRGRWHERCAERSGTYRKAKRAAVSEYLGGATVPERLAE